MARDFLCTPAAGTGVERIFNGARDVCHYRRSRFRPDTIRALMILHHFDKSLFDQEVMLSALAQVLDLLDETVEAMEQEEAIRTRELQDQIEAEYISDDDSDSLAVAYATISSRRRRPIP